MRIQYKPNISNFPDNNQITSSNTYFYGFVLHHSLCILGLSVPIFNEIQTTQSKQCGPLILLCFMLGELPNIPRLCHKILSRKFTENEGNVHNNTLHSVYFVFKGSFIWCRLGLIQLTWNVMQPLAPMNVLITAWSLNVFGIIAVLWEWRMMQFKNYQATSVQNKRQHRIYRNHNSMNQKHN